MSWATIQNGRWRAHIDCADFDCLNGDPAERIITAEGEYPAGSGLIRTLQARVRRSAPAAFNFAMFADTGIDVHHHKSSDISPTIITTTIHTNGYVKVDHWAHVEVDFLDAVGAVHLGKSGGELPDGSDIPAIGYNWAYDISRADADNPPRCYPPIQFPPVDFGPENWLTPTAGVCPSFNNYSAQALLIGDLYVASLLLDVNGATSASSVVTFCGGTPTVGRNNPVTGGCIQARPGEVHVHELVIEGGATRTGPAAGNEVEIHYNPAQPEACTGAECVPDCNECNQGTTDAPQNIGGNLHLHPIGWAPPTIAFPTYDYENVALPAAQADEALGLCPGPACHYFAGNTNFHDYISDPTQVDPAVGSYNPAIDPCGKCMTWLDVNQDYTATSDTSSLGALTMWRPL